MPVDEKLLDFVGRLRAAGIQISLAESKDALESLKVIPLERMGTFRSSLRATLVKKEYDYPVFDAVFDGYFIDTAAALSAEDYCDELHGDEAAHVPLDAAEMVNLLRDAVLLGTDDDITALARIVAKGVGIMEGGFGAGSRPVTMMAGGGYYLFRAMQWLNFREMAAELEELAAAGLLVPDLPPVLAVDLVKDRLEMFRLALERETRRRVSAARGQEAAARGKRIPHRPEEVDFTGATLKQVEDMRRILPSLARRLAARLARKSSHGKRGRVDIRNTLRHSLSSGGVPIDVRYRKRVPAKPELFILCDVSGSVRTFSTFTLQLVYSLHQQFRSVRSFAFIDRVDEITELFNSYEIDEAMARVYRDADVVDGDGHSDVGRALEFFNREFAPDLSAKSTVLVLSDARNNALDPRAQALEDIKEKARRVYWLNPEPNERWDTGDSVIGEYERHCHSAVECRNLKQLADFVYNRA